MPRPVRDAPRPVHASGFSSGVLRLSGENRADRIDAAAPTRHPLRYLANATTLEEQIGELTNVAKGLPRLGLPAYNWLADHTHAVMQKAGKRLNTIFPQGPALGASFDSTLMRNVAAAIGAEARAQHAEALADGRERTAENVG